MIALSSLENLLINALQKKCLFLERVKNFNGMILTSKKKQNRFAIIDVCRHRHRSVDSS
jgi:hypothetical protein